jgi:uncharacterized membrane protein YcaP (DUF421 family)
MDTVYRALVIYVFLLIIFRIAGERVLGEITTFDLLLILIISEATQQAMVNNDHSLVGAMILITTLVGIDITLSLMKQRFPRLAKVVDGLPVILVKDGKIIESHASRERVSKDDILAAARSLQGIERMDQIKYAIVEESGKISIVPTDRP